jgi:putative flippase GtrA
MRRSDPSHTFSRFIRYCLVGTNNSATDVAIFLLIRMVEIGRGPANVISYTIALSISFVLNRNLTIRYSTYDYELIPAAQCSRFVGINLLSQVGSTAIIWHLAAVSHGRPSS